MLNALNTLKMASPLSRIFILLLSCSLIQSAPLQTQRETITKYERPLGKRRGLDLNVINKRSEAGPELGGVSFPDPSIFYDGTTWYAFGTGANGKNIQMASSPDFNSWTLIDSDALPNLAPAGWVDQSGPNTWAPDVVQVVSYTSCMSSLWCTHTLFRTMAPS